MAQVSGIGAHREVRAADGSHVGTVDAVEGGRIELTREDSPYGEHRFVDLASVERVDEHVNLAPGASAA